MGFWENIKSIFEEPDEKDVESAIEKDTLFVTREEEISLEDSMYGKLQLYKSDVAYIREVFPDEGCELEKQIDLIIELLEKTNSEQDEQIKGIFATLEEQYMKAKRLADGEYTIRQLQQQISEMDKKFDEIGFDNDKFKPKDIDEFRKYIDLIQTKVSDSDKNDENPLLSAVQRQKFNSISLKAEYRLKMLEFMLDVKKFSYTPATSEKNPFENLSDFKKKMFSGYFMEDSHLVTNQYDKASKYEKLYNEFYINIFLKLDSIASNLREDFANASMIGDFSIEELFDSKNGSISSFKFLREFAEFKLILNDVRSRIDGLDELKTKRDEENAKKIAEEEEQRAIAEKEKAENDAKVKKEEAERLAVIEKRKNMTSEEIDQEIYRIEHDLTATGNRFVNILDFQKRIARARGLLDTESEVQSPDLHFAVVDIITLEILLGKLNEVGTNYAVFPDCQECSNGGYLIIVSNSDADKLEVPKETIPYSSNLGYPYMEDECFGEYPVSVINRLSSDLKSKYKEDFHDNLFATKIGKSVLYNLSYMFNQHYKRPSGYSNEKNKIRNALLEIERQLTYTKTSSDKLKDIMCYIEFRANENIIPVLQEMKDSEIPAFLEPMPQANRNEINRDNIRIYFRRSDLSRYLETVEESFLDKKRYVPIKWGEDCSIEAKIAEYIKWPSQKEQSS